MESQELRTPADLIVELDGEAMKFTIVFLVVTFEHLETVFIRSDHTNRVGGLDEATAQGGDPIGFIGMKADDEGASFYCRVLREYAGEKCFSQYLASNTDEVAEMLGLEKYKSTPEWVN